MLKNDAKKERICKAYNIETTLHNFTWGKMEVIEIGKSGDRQWIERISAISTKDGIPTKRITSETGMPKFIKTNESEDGCWFARINNKSANFPQIDGIIFPFPEKNAQKIAHGWGLHSALVTEKKEKPFAWHEFLFEMEDNTFVYVQPNGNKKDKPFVLHFSPFEVTKVQQNEFASYLASTNIDPKTFGQSALTILHKNKFLRTKNLRHD